MRPYSGFLLGLALLLCAPRAADGQVIPGGDPFERSAPQGTFYRDMLHDYNQVMERWRGAVVAADAKGLQRIYGPGSYLLLSDADPVQGVSAILGALRRSMPTVLGLRTGVTDFAPGEGVMYALGPYWLEFRTEVGEVRSQTGTHLTVLVKQPGGWRIRTQVLRPALGG